MTRKVLYLGLDPPPGVVHYPVIQTVRMDGPELKSAVALWPQFSHVLFTSKTSVRYWFEVRRAFDKKAIAIGAGTGKELKRQGIEPAIVPVATQEGVIEWLEKEPVSFLFYPRSRIARPLLVEYLRKKGIRFLAIDLYDTVFQKIEPVPDLNAFDEIVFTSPSTVEGFLHIFGAFPQGKILTPIGPVTTRALTNGIDIFKIKAL